ncbi:MAG: hypothetical protein A2Y78_00275 [Acidobacteria bacterium RBG_13_68_16]|nr:MAG: hypothetical protein A2Y78_00275 [Acidobacteria bacterium RBG_13_68_16]
MVVPVRLDHDFAGRGLRPRGESGDPSRPRAVLAGVPRLRAHLDGGGAVKRRAALVKLARAMRREGVS